VTHRCRDVDDGEIDSHASDLGGEEEEDNLTKQQSHRTHKESRLLRFYPSQWQDILESGKKKFHLWLATTDP
jgi:hypothetical protein